MMHKRYLAILLIPLPIFALSQNKSVEFGVGPMTYNYSGIPTPHPGSIQKSRTIYSTQKMNLGWTFYGNFNLPIFDSDWFISAGLRLDRVRWEREIWHKYDFGSPSNGIYYSILDTGLFKGRETSWSLNLNLERKFKLSEKFTFRPQLGIDMIFRTRFTQWYISGIEQDTTWLSTSVRDHSPSPLAVRALLAAKFGCLLTQRDELFISIGYAKNLYLNKEDFFDNSTRFTFGYRKSIGKKE